MSGRVIIDGNNNAQESFGGTAGKVTYTFAQPQNGIVVSNDGTVSLTVKINGYYFEVKAGEVLPLNLFPFTVVTIVSTGSVAFRAFGLGTSGVLNVIETYLIPKAISKSPSSNASTYKGTEFMANAAKKLKAVGAKGSAISWELWTIDATHKFTGSTAVVSGTFGNVVDADLYYIGLANSAYTLIPNQSYAIVVKYLDGTTSQYHSTLNNDAIVTATMYNYQANATPIAGNNLSLLSFTQDFKLEVL